MGALEKEIYRGTTTRRFIFAKGKAVNYDPEGVKKVEKEFSQLSHGIKRPTCCHTSKK